MANKEFDARIKNKRDTSANWESKNPVILDGEIIFVDTNAGELRAKIGDGTKTYTQLPFSDEVLRNLIGGKVDKNTDAIDALETVAAGKADKTHAHPISDVTDLQVALDQLQTNIDSIPQPDLSQNDPTAADYVKNRTHWKEIKTGVLIPETSIEFANAGQPVEDPFILEMQEGSTYEVTWNGNVYRCVAYIAEGPNTPSIGNGTIISVPGGNDEPFFITFYQDITMVFAEEAGTHTVSISGETFTWHTLDKRYLPANLATTDDVQSVANDVQSVANDVNKKMNSNNPVGTGSFSMNRKAGSTIGNYSHAEGYDTTASGSYSHAEGGYTTASEHCSHAEGSATTASGIGSHAEGITTTASGSSSHAEGTQTTASGNYSHAEGGYTTASGSNSHAEGSYTTASGSNSHAEGSSTIASGNCSHAEGKRTIAAGESQHAQGKYNVEDTENKYAHIVGNGTSASARSNAHTIDWSGNAWFAGGLKVGGTGQDDGAQTVMLNGDTKIILASSTDGSTKKFEITVNDSGVLTATEIV